MLFEIPDFALKAALDVRNDLANSSSLEMTNVLTMRLESIGHKQFEKAVDQYKAGLADRELIEKGSK